jgi:hypothetical protein
VTVTHQHKLASFDCSLGSALNDQSDRVRLQIGDLRYRESSLRGLDTTIARAVHDPILICSRADSLLFQAQAHFPEGVRQIKSVAALEQGRSGTHLRDPVCQWGCLSNLVRGSPMTTVPLPSTLTFVASGLGGLVLLRWRRTKKAAMLAAAWAKHQIEIWRDRREAVFLFARITKEALQIRLLANG